MHRAMSNRALVFRSLIVGLILIGATLLLHASTRPEPARARKPLHLLPASLADWKAGDIRLTQRVIEAAGVDDYINRLYTNSRGTQIELYIGYYNNQKSGDVIHSPRNCLPAAGWERVRTGSLAISVDAASPIMVNEFVVEKGLARQLILYWYHGRGRVVASEYTAKFWMIADAITRNRTDGALVRVAIPMKTGESAARTEGVRFVQSLYPQLNMYIPD